MKVDLNMSQLISKVSEIAGLKRDYLVNTDSMSVSSSNTESLLNINGTSYKLQDNAERQLAAMCGIPYAYINRIGRTYPRLLDENYNTLLGGIHKSKLIRTIGGDVRAVLSDRYKKFENEMLLKTLLPLVEKINGLSVVSASLTPERMYIKMISEREKAEVKVGDAVAFGAVITNSEIGMGSIVMRPFCMRLVCTNGMALPNYLAETRKIHLGKKFSSIEEYEGMPDDIESMRCNIGECLASALDPIFYLQVINKMKAATEIKIVDIDESLERVVKHYGLDETEKNLVKCYYTTNKDESLYGLVNAVTRSAQDASTYLRATELEKIGSDILYDSIISLKRNKTSLAGVVPMQ